MQVKKRPPRPKKWTMRVVGSTTFLRGDRIEYLLNFRAEYRQKLKVSRLHADSFARAEALQMLGHMSVEAAIGLVILGKKLLLG